MRTGKIPINMLKRSIIKELKSKNSQVIRGAEVGADNALLRLEPHEDVIVSTESYEAYNEVFAAMAVKKVANNLACGGGEPVAVTLSLLLPKRFFENDLKQYMKKINQAAEEAGVEIIGGDTRINPGIKVPFVTITCMGKISKDLPLEQKKVSPGQELVVSKWIGMEGAFLIAKAKEEELLERYPYSLVEAVKCMEHGISVFSEAACAIKSGISGMHDLSEGGILGGLWEFAEKHGVGLEIDLKKIPVRQEIIEICEFYDINPYLLRSGGCLLMAVDNGAELVRELLKVGISASVIGRVTEGNDRVIYNGEEKRFLDLPQADEIYKVDFAPPK